MRETRGIIWGGFLIVLGVLLLLERIGSLHVPVGSLWPMILFVIAISNLARQRYGSAVMFLGLGSVFLCCTMRWFGLSYEHSWPLLMVAAGLGIVVRALTEPECRPARIDDVPHV